MTPVSSRPKAFAACRVTPANVSAGVMRNSVQAMFITNSKEVNGDEPGLQSVANAIGTLCSRKELIGGIWVSLRV
jgi:hypothetical protein